VTIFYFGTNSLQAFFDGRKILSFFIHSPASALVLPYAELNTVKPGNVFSNSAGSFIKKEHPEQFS
jgi:hypothetical protein